MQALRQFLRKQSRAQIPGTLAEIDKKVGDILFCSDFEKKCKKELDNLIEFAENISSEEVQKSFQHIVKNMKKNTNYNYFLTEKTLHNVTNIYTYINYLENKTNENTPKHIIIILKLYSYLHCIESRYTYKVIGNILRVIKEKKLKGDLFDNSHSGIQCFNNLKDSANLNNENIAEVFKIWGSFVDKNLRNAISHNDYIILENYIIIPSNTREEIENNSVDSEQSTYTFNEINTMYKKANEFQNAFKSIAQKYGKILGPRY